MDTWGAKVSRFFRRWQRTRVEVKRARNSRRDERDAEELDMAKKGLWRRPTGGGFL